MSNAVVGGKAMAAPITAAVLNLFQTVGGALMESGADAVKIAYMLRAASQLLCDPEIDSLLRDTGRLCRYRVNPIVAALFAPMPKLLRHGLLEEPGDRTLVAIVSLWSAVRADPWEVATRIQRFSQKILRTPGSEQPLTPHLRQEIISCTLPGLANHLSSQVTTLHLSLTRYEEAYKQKIRRVPAIDATDLSSELAAAIARCSRLPDSWVEAYNCIGIADTVVTMALVTGLVVAVTLDDNLMPVDDKRFSVDIPKQPRIFLKYAPEVDRTSISLCCDTSPDVLVNCKMKPVDHLDSFGTKQRQRMAVAEMNAEACLREANDDNVEHAMRVLFGRRLFERMLDPWTSRSPQSRIIERTLSNIDSRSKKLNELSLSERILRHVTSTGTEQSDKDHILPSGAHDAHASLRILFFTAFMRAYFGDKSECFLIETYFFKLGINDTFSQVESTMLSCVRDYDRVIHPAFRLYGPQHSENKGRWQISVLLIGPYTVAPRCFVEPGLVDEHATPMVVMDAVIDVGGGTCDLVRHEPPESGWKGNNQPTSSPAADVDLTPNGTTRYELVERGNGHFYRCFEADHPIDMRHLFEAGFSFIRVPAEMPWCEGVRRTEWTTLAPGQPIPREIHSGVVYRARNNQTGKRLAATHIAWNASLNSQIDFNPGKAIVIRDVESSEKAIEFAEWIGATIVIT